MRSAHNDKKMAKNNDVGFLHGLNTILFKLVNFPIPPSKKETKPAGEKRVWGWWTGKLC